MTTLTCDSCPETVGSVRDAMAHVRANPAHSVTGPHDNDGTTVTVSTVRDEDIVEEDDPDYWDDYEEDDEDWADE